MTTFAISRSSQTCTIASSSAAARAADEGHDLGIVGEVLTAGLLEDEFAKDQLLQRHRNQHLRRLRLQLRRQHADYRHHVRTVELGVADRCDEGVLPLSVGLTGTGSRLGCLLLGRVLGRCHGLVRLAALLRLLRKGGAAREGKAQERGNGGAAHLEFNIVI